MLILPAVDIRGGRCVRLWQGDYDRETVYAEDPREMAERWIRQGARFLHLVDLDGAREGSPLNKRIILDIARNSSTPIEVGGGIRTLSIIDEYLSSGIQRVILGTAAYANSQFLKEACANWPGRVAVDIAAREGKAAISGWIEKTEVLAVDLAQKCADLGAAVIIYTDVLRDGTQKGVNLATTREMARALKIPLIVSGGVSNIQDIQALLPLEEEGVEGVIVGRALYAGSLKLAEALAVAERRS